MESQLTSIVHPTEDVLEAYAFNRLSEANTCLAEEHLLVCSTCQKTLQDIDEYMLLMKAATAACAEDRPAEPFAGKGLSWERALAWSTGVHRVPVTLWAVVLSGICVTALASWKLEPRRATTTAPVAVSLMAFRGEGIITLVPAGTRLDLAIDIRSEEH